MNLPLAIGVIGVIVTTAFGVWGIVVTLRHRYPARITFVREECLSLFHDIVRNMPDLSVLLRDQPVKETLVLLKGYLVNTGAKDITPDMVAQKVSAELPDGFRWIDARVVETSPNVDASLTVENEHAITFEMGLLRCREFLKFQALAEVPSAGPGASSGRRLHKSLAFIHRIADTGAISTSVLPGEVSNRRRIQRWAPVLTATVVIIVILVTICWSGLPVKTNYEITLDSGGTTEVSVKRSVLGTLHVKGVDDGLRMVVPAKEFFSRDDLRPILKDEMSDKIFLRCLMPLLLLMLAAMAVSEYVDLRKARNLRKLLTTESNTTSG